MEQLGEALAFVRGDSIHGVALRGLIWVVISGLFIYGLAKGRKTKQLKALVGWFLMMLVVVGIIWFITFGYAPTF